MSDYMEKSTGAITAYINQKALFADIGKAMVTSHAKQKCLLSQGRLLQTVIYRKSLNCLK